MPCRYVQFAGGKIVMTMNDPLTLFHVAERVARLREAQQRYADLQTDYNLRQTLPLTREVDALIVRAAHRPLGVEFRTFLRQVWEMREAQRLAAEAPTMAGDAEVLALESAVDNLVTKYVEQAKQVARDIDEWNKAVKPPEKP